MGNSTAPAHAKLSSPSLYAPLDNSGLEVAGAEDAGLEAVNLPSYPGYQSMQPLKVVDDERQQGNICGLSRKTFWLVVMIAILIVVAAAVGGGVAGSKAKEKSSGRYHCSSRLCYEAFGLMDMLVQIQIPRSRARRYQHLHRHLPQHQHEQHLPHLPLTPDPRLACFPLIVPLFMGRNTAIPRQARRPLLLLIFSATPIFQDQKGSLITSHPFCGTQLMTVWTHAQSIINKSDPRNV